ncbi:hypothetical protein MSM1_12140 [Mycobacterium sp. SM1]|uniref:hypothetical protein n=1 Tax=Mycobacterium sp. SM1 TaxID=2816243 RepID=UPI001BCE7303|nr:hypothetical protein [Mycobacterium sp. SM1]MBS4729053.1 hypothetical protein [Mycobacterium sp. SM1]
MTERARSWAFELIGARDGIASRVGIVSRVASALGVGDIMRILTTRGEPIIDDPAQLDTYPRFRRRGRSVTRRRKTA